MVGYGPSLPPACRQLAQHRFAGSSCYQADTWQSGQPSVTVRSVDDDLIRRAHQLREKRLRERAETLFEGYAAEVCARLNALHQVVDLRIDPRLFDQGGIPLLERQILEAINDARRQANDASPNYVLRRIIELALG